MTGEVRTWARALAALAGAWVIDRAGRRLAARRARRIYRRLHASLVDAYATRRRYGSTPRFDAAIRAAEDSWLRFQPPTSKGDLTE